MYEVLAQMAGLIICGILWRVARPMGLDADDARRAITSLVYVLLLPALVLDVLWRAPLSLDVVKVAVVAASGVLAGLVLAWASYRAMGTPARITGAMLLAAAFPNATYLGLPVLEQALGPWARSVAIQYDLFACTPLLLTVGITIARIHGGGREPFTWGALLNVPPLWAAILALSLNAANVPMPVALSGLTHMMGGAVVPLMLISLGMGLIWSNFRLASIPVMIPVLIIQLLLMPLLVWWLAQQLGLSGDVLTAVVLEAAMPCMVLGMVICDRYGLDSGLYATVVTVSTAVAMVTLPLWFDVLQ